VIGGGWYYSNGSAWVSITGSAPTFGSAVTDLTPGTIQNNYVPTNFNSGTNFLRIYAAAGGTTITGILASGFSAGQTMLIRNISPTDPLIFTHLSSSSNVGNQFSNENAATVQLDPGAASTIVYDSGFWVFT
jgi:hypothetical protein